MSNVIKTGETYLIAPHENEAPLLTIVVVTYNAYQFLPRTLNSLQDQPGIESNDVEVLVIDGGSTDGTVDLARSYSFVRKVITEPDDGIYDAMNKGAKLATGRWLQFLNAGDSYSHPSSLQVAMAGLIQADNNQAQWAISAAQNLSGGTGPIRRIPSVPHVWWRHAYGLQPHCHQATWFRTRTFLDSGAHALKYNTADDFDVILRFGMLTPPHTTADILIDYLGGGVSEKTSALTPALQHGVRVDRLQLGSFGRFVDRQVGRLISIANETRTTAGRLKFTYVTRKRVGSA